MENTTTHRVDKKSVETDREPFVSVLTPVYNGEEFLRACIESVLNQNYSNWEYVLVNNQSTDGSLPIMEEYAALDDRIRIHNNVDFLPQMENLNHAFRQISPDSKYCKVVHADDLLFPECLTKMVNIADEYPTVGIVGAHRTNGSNVGLDGLPYPCNYKNGSEVARQFLLHGTRYFGAPSNILIRSSLIRKRENVYDPCYLASDVSACLDLLQESDYGFVHQILTFTRLHPNSQTNTVVKENRTDILGHLKIYIDSGPLFLSEKIYKQVMKKQEHVFYIRCARNMLSGNIRESYHRHSEQLQSVGFRVKHAKLFKSFIRELLLMLIGKCGFNLTRRSPDKRRSQIIKNFII